LGDAEGFFDVPGGDTKKLTEVGVLAEGGLGVIFGGDVGDEGGGQEAVQLRGQVSAGNGVEGEGFEWGDGRRRREGTLGNGGGRRSDADAFGVEGERSVLF
jgi:hypothetical protein